jgi:hypothetical protein
VEELLLFHRLVEVLGLALHPIFLLPILVTQLIHIIVRWDFLGYP